MRTSSRPSLIFIAFLFYAGGLGSVLHAEPIIADHSIVADHAGIPQSYINIVKTMMVTIPGESHSRGYRIGCQLLENLDSRYQVNIDTVGPPEAYTDQYLRLTNATWGDVSHATGWIHGYGEEDWYTSAAAIQRTKDHLTYCDTSAYELAAMGFGWCWDMTWHNTPGGDTDAVYQVRWAGSSVGGPLGDLRWGLDDGDSILTGNPVCMQTYLDATAEYMTHCRVNGFPTRVFFTSGPVDGGGNTGENGYQRSLKHDYLRSYVAETDSGVLFDYADILCWSNANQQNTRNWTDFGGTPRTFQYIHDDNMLDLDSTYTEDGDHIGQRGALRLAKALWWMLARIAGWDGATVIEEGPSAAGPDLLIGVRPNPAVNRAPVIRLAIPGGRNAELVIYDRQGRKVHAVGLARRAGTTLPGGRILYDYRWDCRPAAGVYFAEVRYPDQGPAAARLKIVIAR